MINILRSLLLVVIFFSCSIAHTEEVTPQSEEVDYDLQKLVYQVVQLRNLLILYGVEFPLLTDFLNSIREKSIQHSLDIDESIFDPLYAEFEAFEIRWVCE